MQEFNYYNFLAIILQQFSCEITQGNGRNMYQLTTIVIVSLTLGNSNFGGENVENPRGRVLQILPQQISRQ